MNDYEDLAEKITGLERELDTVAIDCEEEDIVDLLEEAGQNLAAARALAQGRS